MNRTEALELILASITKATKTEHTGIDESTDLIEEGIIDSLDSMTILFEIEDGGKIKLDIDEDYEDFKISSLIDLVVAAPAK